MSSKINVGTIGHIDHGKTTITSAIIEVMGLCQSTSDITEYEISDTYSEPCKPSVERYDDNGRSTWADTKKRHNRRK